MDAPLTAIEMTGTIDEHHQLRLHGLIPVAGPKQVRIIILYPLIEEEISEHEWLTSAAHNPAFTFLADAAEDVYTVADGEPFHDSV